MTSEKPKAPVYYMDVYDNLVSAPRELVPMSGVSLTNTPAALDNARLLMDALNTRHKCGLSPRELLEAVRDIRSLLEQSTAHIKELCMCYSHPLPEATMGAIYDALAKHKEV